MGSSEDRYFHVPVMLERCIALLAPALDRPGAVVVDGTLGLGGHSESLLQRFPELRLVGLDRDSDALESSRRRLAPFGERTTLVHAVYDELPEVLRRHGLNDVQGVLLDLGVSSMQLDAPERGFSYSNDVALDMRMDTTVGLTAADVLNSYSVSDLARVLSNYGEERFALRIAKSVAAQREREPFTTSARLVDVVRAAIPAAARRTGGNPAKRTFQALRIEVNGELEALERVIPSALDALSVGGRIVVMSYQSLEDRIVKSILASRSRSTTPPGLPVELPGHEPEFALLTRGAERPDEAELVANPRSAPARLRAAERMREAA